MDSFFSTLINFNFTFTGFIKILLLIFVFSAIRVILGYWIKFYEKRAEIKAERSLKR
jgi:hypothetical protein